jgi:uncharacterized integral membrane protein
MVVLGLLLLAAGIVAILAAVFSTSGTATFLGADLGAGTLFFLGVATTLALLCGLVLTRAGTGRALRHRREHRRLRSLERERGQRRRDEQADDGLPDTRDDLEQTREDT